jgi:ribosomal protein L24
MTYCYDRLQLYDVVKVIHGLKAGRRGHVLEIRPNGYLTLKEVVQVGSVKSVSTDFRRAFNIYLFFQ